MGRIPEAVILKERFAATTICEKQNSLHGNYLPGLFLEGERK
jgi:hypothetical protein